MRQTTTDILEKMKVSKNSHDVIPTGLSKLDKYLDGGFFAKELVVIGGFTGTGKSQLAGQIALNTAQEGYKTAYFSLEISNEMVLARMIGAAANIKPTRVRFDTLTQEEHATKLDVEAEILSLGDLLNFYDDAYQLSEIVKEVRSGNYDFVVIDFIQNVLDGSSDEYSRLSKVALTLQKLAKETNSCILIVSQLSNTAAKEGSKSKNLEYKGSGSIAMVCDLGFFLERPNNRGDEYEPSEGTILTLKKNRRGSAGSPLRLGYKLPGGMIYEL